MPTSSRTDPESLFQDKERLFEETLQEADRLYELGLTRFIDTKAMKLGMTEQAVAKLRVMLLKHHRERLDKIRRVDR